MTLDQARRTGRYGNRAWELVPRRAGAWLAAGWLTGAAALGAPARALAAGPAVSPGAATADALGIGVAQGCLQMFPGLDTTDFFEAVSYEALTLRDEGRFGDQLAGICLNSQVASAAGLGSAIGGARPTRTVAQYGFARRRLERRLPGRRGLRAEAGTMVALGGGPTGPLALRVTGGTEDDRALGFFTGIELERRDRDQTALESGYRLDTTELFVGVDYKPGDRSVVGLAVSYADASGRFDRGGVVGGGGSAPAGLLAQLDTDAEVRGACGGLLPGGQRDDRAWKVTAFTGLRADRGPYASAAVEYARRRYGYDRDACAIEAPSADSLYLEQGLDPDGNPIRVLTRARYAGTISGRASADEWSAEVRAGWPAFVAGFSITPELGGRLAKVSVGRYEERGVSAISESFCPTESEPVDGTCTISAPDGQGGTQDVTFAAPVWEAGATPTGLELAIGEQRVESLQTSLGLVVGRPFEAGGGTIEPFVRGTSIHEFADDARDVPFRLAQDLRGAEARFFTYRTDAPDRDLGVVEAGLRAAFGWASGEVSARTTVADSTTKVRAIAARLGGRF